MEVHRVLRPEGTLWLNLGDKWADDSGHGNAGGTNTRIGKRLRQAMGSIHRDRLNRSELKKLNLKAKDLIGIPWRVAFKLRDLGWYLRSDIIWAKKNTTPESVKDRPSKSHEYLFLLTKSAKYYYDHAAIRERSIYEKGSRKDFGRNGWRNKRDVWFLSTVPFKGAHFAVFPPKLVQPCILAGCPIGGIVMDPFMGTGTVASVALRLHRKYIGIDLNPEYIEMAKRRTLQETMF